MADKKESEEKVTATDVKDAAQELEAQAEAVERVADKADDRPLKAKAADTAQKAGEVAERAKVAQIQGASESSIQALIEEVRGLRSDLKSGVKVSSLSDAFNVLGL